MSRAFIREDIDPPERSGKKRSASGLPPGAINYITARGAARLRAELTTLQSIDGDAERIAEIQRILDSVEVVRPQDAQSGSVLFGSTVTVIDRQGKTEIYAVVGVDELDFEPHAVSWVSPIGKVLLGSEIGDRISLEDGRTARIVKIE